MKKITHPLLLLILTVCFMTTGNTQVFAGEGNTAIVRSEDFVKKQVAKREELSEKLSKAYDAGYINDKTYDKYFKLIFGSGVQREALMPTDQIEKDLDKAIADGKNKLEKKKTGNTFTQKAEKKTDRKTKAQ